MTPTDVARRAADADSRADTGATTDTGAEFGVASDPAPTPVAGTGVAVAPRTMGREADGLAVASFVLGLVGLLVFNVLLGPTAIVMALLALARRTRRPGRARLGLALGIADLAVLAVLVTVNGTLSWSLGG